MVIKFALNTSDEVKKIKNIINSVEAEVNLLLANNNYGAGINEIYVGWICVSPQYEQFFKPRKPKFFKKKEMKVDGKIFELVNTLEYEIKLDYEILIDESEARLLIKNLLFKSLIDNIKLNKNIKDFNLEQLSTDLNSNL